jgi:hypothetical protein
LAVSRLASRDSPRPFAVGPVLCGSDRLHRFLTRTINGPINRQLGSWTDEDVDPYPAARRRWDHSHAVRATCRTIAFVSYIILANH